MKSRHAKLLIAMTLSTIGATAAFAADRTVALHVDGLSCQASQVMVRKGLERMTGVKVARMDVDASTVDVVVTNEAVSDAALVTAIAKAGYQSRINNKSP